MTSPDLLAAPRELVHVMAARRIETGDTVACPIEGAQGKLACAPVIGRDPARHGRVLVAVNGHALVRLGDLAAWFPQDRLTRLGGPR